MSEFNCKVISYKNQITNIENNFKTSVDQNQDLKNENEDLKQQIMESKSEINNPNKHKPKTPVKNYPWGLPKQLTQQQTTTNHHPPHTQPPNISYIYIIHKHTIHKTYYIIIIIINTI
jgi:regulator of replication initiation timing